MKKIIYLLLVVFGMNAPKTIYAQEILGVYPHYDSPCEGTVVNIYVDRAMQNAVDSIIWTKNGSKSALPAGWTYDSQIGHVDCYGFSVVDNGNYEVTCYMTNGSLEMVNVQLSVNPNPNAGYTLTPKCFGTVLQPVGADLYYGFDDNGGFSVLFTSDTIIGSIVGGGFRAMNNNGCYTDVSVGAFTSPAVFAVTLSPTKWLIKPGQTTTLTASANWPIEIGKTKWYKNKALLAQGCTTLTVSDTGLYMVRMKSTVVSGGCAKTKQVRIKPKVAGLRIKSETEFVIEVVGESEEESTFVDDEDDLPQKIESSKHEGLKVYPNPAQDQIQMTGYDKIIEILDLNGRLVNSFVFDTFAGNDQPQTIDVSSLPNGMYLVRSGEQTVKLSVQR